jgi:hypothetical protein
VWVPRYLIGAAAPTALLVAIAVTSLPPRRSATMAIVGLVWAVVALGALPRRAPGKFDWRRFARRIEVAVGSPRDVYALEAYTAAPFERYAGAGTRVHVIHALAELPQGDAWLVYRPESFTAGSPTEAVKQLGHTIVVAISAETAGQRIVAIRLR